ncbi:MAG: hypothetical protein HC945_01875 [Nitrosarchaeum sp.]|nr:hypothetical protein [Nitrosarchaeum sp.]
MRCSGFGKMSLQHLGLSGGGFSGVYVLGVDDGSFVTAYQATENAYRTAAEPLPVRQTADDGSTIDTYEAEAWTYTAKDHS